MPAIHELSQTILHWLGWNSVYAAIALGGVLLLLRVWRRAPAFVVHLCWWLVFVRLLLPVGFGLPFSIGSLLPDTEATLQPTVLVGFATDEKAATVGNQHTPSERSGFDWPVALTTLWAAGALVILTWLAARRRKFIDLLRSASPVEDRVALGILDQCSIELELRRQVRLVHGEGMVSPFTVGLLRPVIWIPNRLLENLDPAFLRCLVAHELVHVARFDDAFIHLQNVLQSLFFFHPLVWLAGSRIDRSRERACDEHVVAAMNFTTHEYGRSLIETLRFNIIAGSPMAGFGNGRKRSLEMRLRALSSTPNRSRLTILVPLVVAWLLLPLAGSAREGDTTASLEPPAMTPVTETRSSEPESSEIARVGGNVKAPRVIKRVEPVYPAEARRERVAGVVILEAVIDENGRVESVNPLKGLPFGLTNAAADAVRQWEFEPATKEGVPVKVVFHLTINFRMTGVPALSNPLPDARVTSPFGARTRPAGETIEMHAGIDLAAPSGTPVPASGDGEVFVATTYDANRADSGTFIIIDHGSDIKTFYSHLDTLAVVAGQTVHAGDTIGTVGTTGVSSGPHLHFEVWSADHPIDPARMLKK